ncbi:MAG: substrate-binding domain-containing protein [Bacillota bacterium]|nr:substrate-binding domain-containing protein [Bacillota bacterium]
MKDPIALILVEPGFRQAYWWQVYEESLNDELSRRSLFATFVYDAVLLDNSLPESLLAILFGTSAGWLHDTLLACRLRNLRPIIVSPEPKEPIDGVSLIAPDRTGSTRRLVAYLTEHGKNHLAMFNPRPESVNGKRREEAFIRSCAEASAVASVFSERDATACADRIIENVDKIDGIVCVDDLAGVFLLSVLADAGIQVPDRLYVAGFGDSVLSRHARPPLTTVTMDMKELARQAIGCALYLYRNPRTVSLNCQVANHLIVRESTALCPDTQIAMQNRIEIANAAPAVESAGLNEALHLVNSLETCLAHANETDLAIIKALMCGLSCRKVARQLFMSESTVYYRIERLRQLSGTADRKSFLALLNKYTSC